MLRQYPRRTILLALITGIAWLAPVQASAQIADIKTWTHKDLGISMRRPAELYELDPEPPADDINGEVEWGPTDHAWTILVTSQKPTAARGLADVATEIKKQQSDAEIAEIKIGDGIAALRVTLHDSDSFTSVVYFFDKRGATLIAIELSITLGAQDAGKDRAALKTAHAATLGLFDGIVDSVRFTTD